MSETSFKIKAMADLKKIPNCWILKTQERGRVGTPDLLICLKGRFVAIELKRDGCYATKIQKLTLDRIQAADGVAFEACPASWGAQLLLLQGMK